MNGMHRVVAGRHKTFAAVKARFAEADHGPSAAYTTGLAASLGVPKGVIDAHLGVLTRREQAGRH